MNRRRSGQDDVPWPTTSPRVRIVSALPDDMVRVESAEGATLVPPPCPAAPAEGEQAARRIQQLIAARDQLLGILVVLDEHCRSPAPAMLDLAIHRINQEIGE